MLFAALFLGSFAGMWWLLRHRELRRPLLRVLPGVVALGAIASTAAARDPMKVYVADPISIDIDEPTKPRPGKGVPGDPVEAFQDTVWIADWAFDAGGVCVSTGWSKIDNRILNHGENYWAVDNRFDGLGGLITGKAAILAKHDLCWARDGYGNDWDFSIILRYSGAGATLGFGKSSDGEPGADFVTVEADSLGLSEVRANICINPAVSAADLRVLLLAGDGLDGGSTIGPLALPNFGAGTHEVYIRFASNGAYSDEDGGYPSANNAALIVDNIVVTGGTAYTETFEGVLSANVTLVNTANSTPFCAAPWLRLFSHITDNDRCTENTTCAWLDTDPLRLAFFPSMAFGPGQALIHNWLDDVLVSPWVSLASTPSATGTVLSFRSFPGNVFGSSRIVQAWRVRSKARRDNTDTSTLGDLIDCISPWGPDPENFRMQNTFSWRTSVRNLSTSVDPAALEVQVSMRISDWQYLANDVAPATLNTGPGPYMDRVRIGRRVLNGPAVSIGGDTRSQAQDAFPTVQNAISPGQHFSPDGSNRFGTCAFSPGADLGINGCCPVLITGDSITLEAVVDARGAGGIASVKFFGAITSGPHAGKAPAPYSVGGNGFFEVNADSARSESGIVVANRWFVDLDDTYFRGGDRLEYVWLCADNSGGKTSSPTGLSATPASVAQARAAVAGGGLREVSYLPTVNWSAAYLARIAADANGDLDPTVGELAASTQKNCVLYVQQTNSARRSGDTNRTSFMYWLDAAGYRGSFDVYDVQGAGNTNNQLGGRANVGQCSGYALVIEDDGRSLLVPNVPDGSNAETEKINQAAWYRSYLAQGVTGLAGTASVWILGESTAFDHATNPLFSADMGLTGVANDQALSVNPDVQGNAAFTFASGGLQSFVGDKFSLNGGCPVLRNYDGALAAGTAVVTHNYKSGATTGSGAIVMNKNAVLKWNTVWMGFGWADIRDTFGGSPATPELTLIQKIFNGVLPVSCLEGIDPTTIGDPEPAALPRLTTLYPCEPNPFNPTALVRFDIATPGPVDLSIFDASGRLVRTLVKTALAAGSHRAVWNGLTESGAKSASGVYFARLVAPDANHTRKGTHGN